MKPVALGDIFRHASSSRRHWRVVAVRDGIYELACVEKPNLSRFVSLAKLLEPFGYSRKSTAGNKVVGTARQTK